MKFCRPPLLGFCLIIGVFLAYLSAHAQISAQKTTIYTLQQPTLFGQHPKAFSVDLKEFEISGFHSQQASDRFIIGILTGVVSLLVVYGLFLLITVKDPLYLFYVSYVAAVYLWVITDEESTKPILNCLMNLTALHFMQVFIGQTREKPIFKMIRLLKLIFLALTVVWLIPLSLSVTAKFSQLLLLLLVLNGTSVILIVWSVYERLKAGYKQAWFYLASIVPVFFFAMLETFSHASTVAMPIPFLSSTGMQLALIIQVVILTFGLAYRFNSYRLDREELLLELNKEQREMTSMIMESQENERRKISDQLHDEVGTMLSIANWQINEVLSTTYPLPEKQKLKLEKATETLENVSATIRKLGHHLSPWAIQKYGLNRAITSLAYQINISEKIALEYVVIGFESSRDYPLALLNNLYRIIQELLNNILKHAGASNAYLELVAEQGQLRIIVEDNGKGFDSSLAMRSSGIGLENIRAKLSLYNGEMEITRKPEHGTLVVIRIPLS